ncbi:hypothetical protein Q4567_00170 [Aliiglaciecola sp. 2_MG-2023]|uniref:hypothetical protein n=1 Tax=unclassified Aliiglaciecola TaxID=2593648 RepID=UPI0026E27418|nr:MULTISPECIES: hypothetical protein [unclassified Aliiglaciecola]MDO6709122.1 hypothetical protein [Aliiglaciecola sp. 2_MG-2023]MDO6750270.1 hypothetical protein [Aliiglaciecola sp. 1_MG-2023]
MFKKAKQATDAGDYSTALSFYQLAGKIFGEELVAFNIKRCQQKIVHQKLKIAPEINVLVTSDAEGVKGILPTLYSLLNQSLAPKEVILYLPKKSSTDDGVAMNSVDVEAVKKLPNVRIVWCEKQSQFLIFDSFLSNHFHCDVTEDKLFLCVSDNQIYPHHFIETLYSNYLVANNVVAANWISFSDLTFDFPIEGIPSFQYGVLFSTEFFNPEVCKFDDVDNIESIGPDLWLTWNVLSNGVGIKNLEFFDIPSEKDNQVKYPVEIVESLERIMMEMYGFSVSSLYRLTKELCI